MVEAHHHPRLRHRRPAEEAHFDVVRRQPLGDVDVAKRILGREARAIVGAEGAGIVAQHFGHPLRRMRLVQRFQQIVVEGADDVADLCFDLVLRRVRPLPRIAPDDELHARQVRHREIGKEGRDAAVVELRQRRADPLAKVGGVAVARHEDQNRDEAVEAVAARERADARALLELQDRHGRIVEDVGLRLEKLGARIVLQNVEKRLAGMALRIEAGALQDVGDLYADERNALGGLREGAGGEEPDDPELALDLARLEDLYADIVHVVAPVDARVDVRLGHDQRIGSREERADLRRQRHHLGAAPQHRHGRVAEQPEAARLRRLLDRLVERPGVGIFARAEEDEVALVEPLQEGDRLLEHRRREAAGGRGRGR